MAASYDFSSFSTAEKQALLTAAKSELLRRAGIGSIQTGAEIGNSFSMTKMTEDGLARLISGLSQSLGYAQDVIQVRPNFAGTAFTTP